MRPFLLADIGEGKLLFLQVPWIARSSIRDDELSRAIRIQRFKLGDVVVERYSPSPTSIATLYFTVQTETRLILIPWIIE